MLFSLPSKNTDSLIGAVARVLEDEGIELVDSTKFLGPLLPAAGVLTRRAPDEAEAADIAYGREIAQQIAGLDLGQTVVMRDRACVAVEAMEGTDETIERAARIAGGQRLVVVKVSKPQQDMRFDVPVVGLKTIEVMRRVERHRAGDRCGPHAAVRPRRADRAADDAGIAIQAFAPAVTRGCGKQGKSRERKTHSRGRGRRRRVRPEPRARLARDSKAPNSSASWTPMPSAPRQVAAEFGTRVIPRHRRACSPNAWTP